MSFSRRDAIRMAVNGLESPAELSGTITRATDIQAQNEATAEYMKLEAQTSG
jgi:hypothetical protein